MKKYKTHAIKIKNGTDHKYLVAANDSPVMAEIDFYDGDLNSASIVIGNIGSFDGGQAGLFLSVPHWDAFMALVNKIDKTLKTFPV